MIISVTFLSGKPILSDKEEAMMDITAPEHIEISISEDGKTIWINGQYRCLFRACKIKNLSVDDRREKK